MPLQHYYRLQKLFSAFCIWRWQNVLPELQTLLGDTGGGPSRKNVNSMRALERQLHMLSTRIKILGGSLKPNIVHQNRLAQLQPKLQCPHKSYQFEYTSDPSTCSCPDVAMPHTICFRCMRTIRDRLRLCNLPLGTQIDFKSTSDEKASNRKHRMSTMQSVLWPC